MKITLLIVCIATLLTACGGETTIPDGEATPIATPSAEPSSSPTPSTSPNPSASPSPSSSPTSTPSAAPTPPSGEFNPGPAPTETIRPKFGELSFFQLKLTGSFLGEAALIVGPDGSIALLDLGSTIHDDVVREFIRKLNTEELTPARGYARQRGELEVDWIIVTHFHSDHSGAYKKLVVTSGKDNLQVTKGVIHRGFTDLGSGITETNFLAMCKSLRGNEARLNFAACTSEQLPPCDVDSTTDTFPASQCKGLFQGELSDPSDDNAGLPSTVALGNGARITLIAASNHVSNGATAIQGQTFGVDDNGYENARSLVGVITYGDFHYHFGGDLTGSGRTGDPDVETHLAEIAGPAFWGADGVDVTHLHHHARDTSSNMHFVDAVAPNDGRSRNAIAGISDGHLGSPQRGTISRWLDNARLGDGNIWITQRARGGSNHQRLVEADGLIIVQTVQAGRGYWIQAAGSNLLSKAYQSVRSN